MIETNINPVPVKVFRVTGVFGSTRKISDYLHDAEIVPYINDISKERDPMVRQIKHRGRFLHVSTILRNLATYEYEDVEGVRFSAREIEGRLYTDYDY